ncbi:hypothetical protein KKG31_07645 [Patescibacteria group bacterium]|nr:hypothetical protein [Patescibacteria group bacterium]MBU1758941.1 hypothetical protein [Patescibacteria group bacterium]
MIYSDYGHMASSLQLGYEDLKEKYPGYKLQIIFQPHQINRVLRERNEFSQAFKHYDHVTIYDIYAARENLAELLKKSQSINL